MDSDEPEVCYGRIVIWNSFGDICGTLRSLWMFLFMRVYVALRILRRILNYKDWIRDG